MARIRILIVDEAVVVRRTLTSILAADPALEVVGAAATARIALAKIDQVNPDIVIMRGEPAVTDAGAMVALLRQTQPTLPVLLLDDSLHNGGSFAGTLRSAVEGSEEAAEDAARQRLRERLIPRIKRAVLDSARVDSASASTAVEMKRRPTLAGGRPRVNVLALGASTGGPNALTALLAHIPATFAVPVVIVQHMPPRFTEFLAAQLSSQSGIQVREAISGATLVPGHAWIAPGDYHMEVVQDDSVVRLRLHQERPVHSCRPAVDVLFRSVAAVYGASALSVVLTGMGKDGLRGCESIRDAGGQVLVQDEASSIVWGMPGFIARAGLADAVLPLDRLASEIHVRVQRGRRLTSPS
jgi:two-component system, chemotaxis family, protein-glutamate methylesterase/glutaminase